MLFWQDVVLMLCSLPPHIRTLWGNPMMSQLKSVGWSGLSCFSLASQAHGRTAAEKGQFKAQLNVWCHDIHVQLVFYSTFEPVVLPRGCPKEAVGVQKLYEPSPTPIRVLYLGLAANVVGYIPLMPLFLFEITSNTLVR